MEGVERGMMAWSLAGHDKGKLYVVARVEEEYAWLCDGRVRPLEKPKKKKWKHIQLMKRIPVELRGISWDHVKNEEIRHSIKAIGLQNDRR